MWSKEWPTEPGFYLFYGWLYKSEVDRGRPPDFTVVEMSWAGPEDQRFKMYVANGGFVYPKEAGPGKFQKINLPEPPSLED